MVMIVMIVMTMMTMMKEDEDGVQIASKLKRVYSCNKCAADLAQSRARAQCLAWQVLQVEEDGEEHAEEQWSREMR
jgi:hypothetical protein